MWAGIMGAMCCNAPMLPMLPPMVAMSGVGVSAVGVTEGGRVTGVTLGGW